MIRNILLFVLFPFSFVFSGTTIVDNINGLVTAVENATAGDTILIESGTYTLNKVQINISADSVTVGSLSGNRESVVLQGQGMGNSAVSKIFWVNADHFTARDMTLQLVYDHAIQTDVDTDGLTLKNLLVRDVRTQLIKVPWDGDDAKWSEEGLIEDCSFEFSSGHCYQQYSGGPDILHARNWTVRNNICRGIRSPTSSPTGGAIMFWQYCDDIIIENNKIINCDRGIIAGLTSSHTQTNVVIRNNMIYHADIDDGNFQGDASIVVESAPGVEIYNNTIFQQHDYQSAIEYRWSSTTNALVANNCIHITSSGYFLPIFARDGAGGTETNNVTNAQSSWFVDIAAGDLHLSSAVASLVDQGTGVTGLNDDYDRQTRPQGTAVDIGADEYFTAPLLQVRLYLEGLYNPSSAGMHTTLKDNNLLVNYSPYDDGTHSSLSGEICDWVELQLSDTPAGEPIWQQSVLLQSNGWLCDPLNSYEQLCIDLAAGDYYLSVSHRNHLRPISSSAVMLMNGSTSEYTFGDKSDYYSPQQYKLIDTASALYAVPAGDMDQDFNITSRDYTLWYNAISDNPGYTATDLNGDGKTDKNDYILWLFNAQNGLNASIE
jgi:hypothetical protein